MPSVLRATLLLAFVESVLCTLPLTTACEIYACRVALVAK
jgi:hypothetical protein